MLLLLCVCVLSGFVGVADGSVKATPAGATGPLGVPVTKVMDDVFTPREKESDVGSHTRLFCRRCRQPGRGVVVVRWGGRSSGSD